MFLFASRKKLVVLFTTGALLFGLAACGTGTTGGASLIPTLPSATDLATSQPPASNTIEPAATGGATVSPGGPVTDQASLIDALRQAGATVTIGGSIEQPFMSITGTQITVNGADVQVFEYADAAAAQADAATFADTLAGKGTTMVTWVASPHAYRAGRMIALYVGDDAAVLKLLQDAMGAPFAEQQIGAPQSPKP